MNRTITLRLGTLLTLAGIVSGAVGGYLVRHDVQTVTMANVSNDLVTLKNESALTHAYTAALYYWAIKTSAKQGIDPPADPKNFLPLDFIHPGPPAFIPEANAAEVTRPGGGH